MILFALVEQDIVIICIYFLTANSPNALFAQEITCEAREGTFRNDIIYTGNNLVVKGLQKPNGHYVTITTVDDTKIVLTEYDSTTTVLQTFTLTPSPAEIPYIRVADFDFTYDNMGVIDGYLIVGTGSLTNPIYGAVHPFLGTIAHQNAKMFVAKIDDLGNLQWLKTYGETDNAVEGRAVVELNDSSYVAIANVYEFDISGMPTASRYSMTCFHENGDTIWTNTASFIDDLGSEHATKLSWATAVDLGSFPPNNGGLLGSCGGTGANKGIWVVGKIVESLFPIQQFATVNILVDEFGTTVCTSLGSLNSVGIPSSYGIEALDVAQSTTDGRLGIIGGIGATTNGQYDSIYVSQLDLVTGMNWTKSFVIPASNASHARSIVYSSLDSTWAVVGTYYAGADEGTFWMKLDSLGNMLDAQTYLDDGGDMKGESVVLTTDGGYFITCSNGQLLKTNNQGQTPCNCSETDVIANSTDISLMVTIEEGNNSGLMPINTNTPGTINDSGLSATLNVDIPIENLCRDDIALDIHYMECNGEGAGNVSFIDFTVSNVEPPFIVCATVEGYNIQLSASGTGNISAFDSTAIVVYDLADTIECIICELPIDAPITFHVQDAQATTLTEVVSCQNIGGVDKMQKNKQRRFPFCPKATTVVIEGVGCTSSMETAISKQQVVDSCFTVIFDSLTNLVVYVDTVSTPAQDSLLTLSADTLPLVVGNTYGAYYQCSVAGGPVIGSTIDTSNFDDHSLISYHYRAPTLFCTFGNTPDSCNSGNGTINLAGGGGVPPYEVDLKNSSGGLVFEQIVMDLTSLSFVNLVAGEYIVSVLDTQNAACISDTLTITDVCCPYALRSVDLECASVGDTVCVWLDAVVPVDAGITGLNYCLEYDPTLLSPTGNTRFGNVVGVGSSAEITLNTNLSGYVLTTTNYLDNSTFQTIAGEVVCIEFVLQSALTGSSVFNACELREAKGAILEDECVDSGILTIQAADNYVDLALVFAHAPDSLMANGNSIPGANTLLHFMDATCLDTLLVDLPNGNGHYFDNVGAATRMQIERDIAPDNYYSNTCQVDMWSSGALSNSDVLMLATVNNFDATSILAQFLFPPSGVPTAAQMIAMDVNRNGKLDGDDVTQLQRRIVGDICEFQQADNYDFTSNPAVPLLPYKESLDWVFIDSSWLSTLEYSTHNNYPNFPPTSGVGYWRDQVPVPEQCLPLCPSGDCCSGTLSYAFQGILLGDGNGSWNNSTNFKDEGTNYLTFDMNEVEHLENSTYRIPVRYKAETAVYGIDFVMDYDETHLQMEEVVVADGVSGLSLTYNDFNGEELRLTSFSTTGIATAEPVLFVEVTLLEEASTLSLTDLGPIEGGILTLDRAATEIMGITVGISGSQRTASRIHLTPNPTTGILHLNLEGLDTEYTGGMTLSLRQVQGQLVYRKTINQVASTQLNIADLTDGLYILTVTLDNGKSWHEKVVKH